MRRLFRSFERFGVELKKAQRFLDYDVISNLVASAVRDPAVPKSVLAWAARNSFRPEERAAILARLGRPASVAQCRTRILADVGRLQSRDSGYWRASSGTSAASAAPGA